MSTNSTAKYEISRSWWGFAIILLVAAGFRFALLGTYPLDDQQANIALQALSVSRNESVHLSGEPGYIALTSVLFDLFGASGFWARFWPALLGTCAVLLPVLYRKWLGSSTALVLAALIALDPVMIGVSRSAGGTMLALVGVMAALGFWLNRRPVLSGVLLGIALTGGSGFWPLGLITVGIIAMWRNLFTNRDDAGLNGAGSSKSVVIVLSVAAVSSLLLSTLFFSLPNGISAIGSSVVEYFSGWGEFDSRLLAGNGLAWLIIELPLIALGIWGFVDGMLKKEQLARFMGVLWALTLVLTLLNPGTASSHFVWVALPMLILAAKKLSKLVRLPNVENRLIFTVELILVLALVIFSFLNSLNLVNNAYLTPEETRNRIIGTFLPIILLAAMTVLFAWGWSYSSTRNGFVTGIVVLLVVGLVSNAWKSAGLGSRPQFEFLFSRGFPLGEQSLLTTVKDISISRTGYADRIDIQVIGLEHPSVFWVLRDFNEVTSASVSDPNSAPSLVLTNVETRIDLPASYRGQKILWSVNPDYAAMQPIDWIRWSLFRLTPASNTELILWAKNDLFPGAQIP